jgi:hypothetical protein
MERPWSREHIRAPRGDESFVANPELSRASDSANRNHDLLADAGVEVQGKSLAELRRWARYEVYAAARDYTRCITGGCQCQVDADLSIPFSANQIDASTIYVGGHQPTLFHPGVWVKNFVVGQLSHGNGAVGLNLVVDSDTMSGTAIRVPHGPIDAPQITSVAFDTARSRQPWEDARILDGEIFASFGRRVAEVLHGKSGVQSTVPPSGQMPPFQSFTPIVDAFWKAAVAHSRRSSSLAECLTAARCRWERSRNIRNLELPVSRVCRLEPFLWFASHLLAHLPRFVSIYNEVLQEYRRTNRVRSRTHPVPDLRETDGWLEAPFRVWREGDLVRQRVFAKQIGGEVQLSDGHAVFAVLPLSVETDAAAAVHELKKLAERGIRFRTRALTTTLFARLCVADLFVHGIGGAKYDQMTDRIISRFFGVTAPEFLTMSATLLLPIAKFPAHPSDENRLLQQLRELKYNSDRHLSLETLRQNGELVVEKRKLVDEQNHVHGRRSGAGNSALARDENFAQENNNSANDAKGSGYARFRRLQEINRQLSQLTNGARHHIEEELQATRKQLAANAVWNDREFSFCLFPADQLHRFMDHVCASTRG